MIPRSITWKASKHPLPSRNKKSSKREDSLDTVKVLNVLQCSIPCADMWYGTDGQTDRQVGSACGHTDHAEREKRIGVESDRAP